MSKIKKLIALTLALAMVLSVSAFAGNYSENTYADADKINADCEDAVELLYALDIMVGDGKNFNPESAVTRAEMAKMIYVILNYGKDDKAVSYTGAKFFTDVEAGYWAEGYINYCASTKLIAGRGDGKFDPTAPVTTAEAAKMLLTAIGYSAEARGYTGANWDKNVLSDASILGLLAGYKANVNTYAPRQWIAVMIENMLLDCYTFSNMYPTINGLLISGGDNWEYEKMAAKYYKLDEFTGYLYATPNAFIDGTKTAGDDKLYFNDANGDDLTVKSSALGFEDLGQQYRVIYKMGTTNVPYSIKATGKSAVAEDALQNITAEVIYSTSNNRSNNKYYFTVGDMTANCGKTFGTGVKFAGVNFLTNNLEQYLANDEVFEYSEMPAYALYEELGVNSNDLVKVIDRDGDGDIEYVLYCDFTYAVIEDADTSTKYGDFVTATDFAGNAVLGLDGGSRLYVDDMIDCDDELEIGNYVKAYFNADDEIYTVEVLPVEEVTYDKRSTKDVFTFSGEKYIFAEEAFVTAADFDADFSYEDEVVLVADGNLVVYAGEIDTSYTALEKINEQLALVYDWKYINKVYYKGGPEEGEDLYQFSYMTIDGEKHTEYYTLSGNVDSDDVIDEYVTGAELADWVDAGWRLFYLHNESDSFWCEEIPGVGVDGMGASTKLLTGYFEELDAETLNTTRETLTNIGVDGFERDGMADIGTRAEVANDVLFFVRTDTNKYEVKTLAELDKGSVDNRTVQVFYKTNSRNVPVVVAGYIDARGLDAGSADGYLYLTETEDGFERTARSKTYDYSRWTALINLPGEEATEATVQFDYDGYPEEGVLYKYTKSTSTGIYTLEAIYDESPADDGIVALYKNSNEIETVDQIVALKNRAVVLKVTEIDLDETITVEDAIGKIENGILDIDFMSMEFTDIDGLEAANVLADEDATFTYYVQGLVDNTATDDFSKGLVYIQVFQFMNPAQELADGQ